MQVILNVGWGIFLIALYGNFWVRNLNDIFAFFHVDDAGNLRKIVERNSWGNSENFIFYIKIFTGKSGKKFKVLKESSKLYWKFEEFSENFNDFW